MPLGIAIFVTALVVSSAVRLLAYPIARNNPRRRAQVERYAPWTILPIAFLYLLAVAWPLAVALVVAAPLVLAFLRWQRIQLPFGTPEPRRSRR
ncbi:MAG: hypothetical protein JWO37_413 [Acidimicrobiales bacterium]|jgi:uncharacterized membrane protein|nr:hypothetical protein [Acidimicrobiales bacterium]